MWPAPTSIASRIGIDSVSTIKEIRLTPAPGPRISAAVLKKADAQSSIPLLSWEVKSGSFNDTAWKQAVTAIRERNQPVMLRPLIKASNPAAYRLTWQRLVTHFRASGDTSAVWVWKPPVPDSVNVYFPGAIYVDWVAADCMTSGPNAKAKSIQKYRSLRMQLAQRAELNSTPVLLLTPFQTSQSMQTQSQRITSAYPEIKGLLFGSLPSNGKSDTLKLSASVPTSE
jgi:cellulose synthase (UDP-forming)